MTTKDFNSKQKHVYFKTYKNLRQIKKVLKHVKEFNDSDIQISVLGKITQNNFNGSIQLEEDFLSMKIYWQELFGENIDFGSFHNPEIGAVFVVGPLTSIFLNRINGKKLANMSTGIYGVLRGLGAHKLRTETYLKALNNNDYLLIIRAADSDLYGLDSVLKID